MQHEIVTTGSLLDKNGNIAEPGWARSLIRTYRRSDIKASPMRIKEWDYYIVSDDEFGIALTVADNGYMGLISASMLDFKKPWEKTLSVIDLMPMGKYKLPETSAAGTTMFTNKNVFMKFEAGDGKRKLTCTWMDFINKTPLEFGVILDEPKMDSMVIATPFDKAKHFYYNQKINCMRAKGSFRIGDFVHEFTPDRAFATLDWGRGVWTYNNTWYWGNGNGIVDGKILGFNIGYGFGNTSAASENLVIYEGVAHKLSQVKFHIPEDSYMKPWTFTSDDGRFEMDFEPVLDRANHMNVLVLESDQHQVFGKFTGKITLDDGRVLEVKDLLGFAEKVHNKY